MTDAPAAAGTPMELDAIPADKNIQLTPTLRRLFLMAGCDPACHACEKELKNGELFQLLSYNGNDEMVHPRCGKTGLKRRDKRVEKQRILRVKANRASGGTGYSRVSKP